MLGGIGEQQGIKTQIFSFSIPFLLPNFCKSSINWYQSSDLGAGGWERFSRVEALMVSTRMESRLESLENVVDGWNRDMEEQATRFELQDARLKKIEDMNMMERLTQFLDGERQD
ncbi:putative nuclear pore complex protein [Sesbania bispinosa]|nr:putative nuclear pore complex protein [Sesbania bispinosa]